MKTLKFEKDANIKTPLAQSEQSKFTPNVNIQKSQLATTDIFKMRMETWSESDDFFDLRI